MAEGWSFANHLRWWWCDETIDIKGENIFSHKTFTHGLLQEGLQILFRWWVFC
jgi:hypothetical protein